MSEVYRTYEHVAGDRPIADSAKLRSARCIARALARMEADPSDPHHGTPTGYNYGCRCDRCREAKRATYMTEEYRARARQRWRMREAERRLA